MLMSILNTLTNSFIKPSWMAIKIFPLLMIIHKFGFNFLMDRPFFLYQVLISNSTVLYGEITKKFSETYLPKKKLTIFRSRQMMLCSKFLSQLPLWFTIMGFLRMHKRPNWDSTKNIAIMQKDTLEAWIISKHSIFCWIVYSNVDL